jgi:hypothetical protein
VTTNLGFRPDFLRAFEHFNLEKWQRWMEQWLLGIEAEPRIDVHDGNLLEALVSLYRAMTDSPVRLAFADAAASLLQTTLIDSSSAQRLSVMIGLVSYARPTSGRAAIRKLVNMDPIWFTGNQMTSIHLEALNAAGRYGLDPWLLRYVTKQQPGSTLQHNLACFRILVQHDHAAEAFLVLDRIIPQVGDRASESALRVELTYAADFLGCVGLLRYAMDRQPVLEYRESLADAGNHFSNAMTSALRRHLSANDLLAFARSYPSTWTEALVPFLAELHKVTLKDGRPLWSLEFLSTSTPCLVVRGAFTRLSASDSNVIRVLEDSMSRSNNPYLFDMDRSLAEFDRFKGQVGTGVVK